VTKPGWTYERSVELPERPERVWRALTDAAELTRWFAEGADVDARAGGRYRFWGRRIPGMPTRERAHQRITRFDAGREIAFEWEIEGVETEAILVVEPVGDAPERTRLRLRHKFPAPPAVAEPRDLVEMIWNLALASLEAYLAE